jgi:hypothetical protein
MHETDLEKKRIVFKLLKQSERIVFKLLKQSEKCQN